MKIIPNKNLEKLAKKIKNKYKKQQQRKGPIKKASKKTINWMKNSKYLQTDDNKTVDYNNDTKLVDLETVDYNNYINLDDLEAIGYNSVMQKLNLPQRLKEA